MKIKIADFEFKKCELCDLNEIMQIQKEAFEILPDLSLLRKNTIEMIRECLLPPHVTLGAWYQGALVAFSILYFPDEGEENLSYCLEGIDVTGLKTVNNKLCIVRRDFRGNSLQYTLSKKLEEYAKAASANLICATVSSKNSYSMNNILRLGYTYNKTLIKYEGLERNLYYKFL